MDKEKVGEKQEVKKLIKPTKNPQISKEIKELLENKEKANKEKNFKWAKSLRRKLRKLGYYISLTTK